MADYDKLMQIYEQKIEIMNQIIKNDNRIIELLNEEIVLFKNFINSIGKKNDKTKESK